MRRSVSEAAAIACLAAFSYGQPSNSAQNQPSKSDVILITIDTLRADHLRCYGYTAIETPNIDRLANDGVRFTQAVAECPITFPSHCSILTGTYPIFHGVRDNTGYRLQAEHSTLAEVLKANGYRTGAFVGAYVLASVTGLNQGFDTYVDGFKEPSAGVTDLSIAEHRARKVMDSALRWLKQAREGERSFAWIHLFDPHAPYAPPPPFSTRYSTHPYDGEIAYVDSVLGSLLRYLTSQNRYASALITLTSDHGEGLGEHGEATHGLFLYDSTLRIPWILKAPEGRYPGQVIARQVQSIDIMPTVLQMLGIPEPKTIQGIGLLSLLEGTKSREPSYALGETFLPRNQYGWSPLQSVRTEEYKFIQAPKPELYDLRTDPKERSNLYATNRTLALQLRQRVKSLASQYSGITALKARVQTKDPSAFQRLLSLGYVASGERSDSVLDTESLPDPKDKVGIFDLLWSGVSDSEAKRYVEAVQKLKQVLATDPETSFARTVLGVTYFQKGDLPLALEELKAALSLRPGELVTTFYLGMTLARLRQDEAAEQAFTKVLELDPGHEGALNNLGIVLLNQRRFEQAAEIYRKIVALKPRDSYAWTNLGLVYLNQNRNEEAIQVLEKALQIDPKVPQIHNNLGLALMNSGKTTEAIVHYRKSISLDPDYAQAHYNLALALKKQGLHAEAEREMSMARRLLLNPKN